MFQGIFDFFVGGDGGDGGGDDSTGGGNEPPALPPEPASGPVEKPRTKQLKVAAVLCLHVQFWRSWVLDLLGLAY